MKAIGGTTRQMMTLYLGSVLIYGVLAVFIAVPLGTLVADSFSAEMLADVGDYAGSGTPTSHIGRDAATGRRPARAGAGRAVAGLFRRAPHRARGDQQLRHRRDFRKGLIDRVLARLRGLPRQPALTLRNTFRRKGRVVLTQITLIMAGVVFIMVMSSAASFTYTITFLPPR